MEKQSKKKKKNKAVALEDACHPGDATCMRVGDSDKVSDPKEKRRYEKKFKISDDVDIGTSNEKVQKKRKLDLDKNEKEHKKISKKEKKINKDGEATEIEAASTEKAFVGEESGEVQSINEKGSESDFELEFRVCKRKTYKKNQGKAEVASYSSSKEVLKDNEIVSDNVLKGETCFPMKDRVEIKNGEDGGRKKKNKKVKKDEEVSEGKGSAVDGEKFENSVELYDENTVEKISLAKKEKKRKKKKDGELGAGFQETEKEFEDIEGNEHLDRNKIENREVGACLTGAESNKKENRKKTKSVKDGSEGILHEREEGSMKKKKKEKGKSVKDDLVGKVQESEESEKHKKKKAKSNNNDSEGKDQEGAKMSVDTADLSENPKSKGSSKRVSFSDHVEIFPSSDGPGTEKKDPRKGLVQGKRFSLEEDEIIKEAVSNYIEEHGLGEDGLEKILHCKSHPEVKNCWKEIGLALPWRPNLSVYYRAHILFERDEKREWTPEEYEIVRKFHEKHGSDWRLLADGMGKHRFHVKDAWRRIRLQNVKRGRWSQEEYQNLFDLVNLDLRIKAFEEKKSKHGMLRDNISWEAISDKLGTRINAVCCMKWYGQLTSPLVAEGKWSDADDYRLISALVDVDAYCMEDVDWNNLLAHRSGDICRKRWKQMVKHLGEHGNRTFAEQVEVLSERYCPDLLEARDAYASKPEVD